jgi:hypothetical protein
MFGCNYLFIPKNNRNRQLPDLASAKCVAKKPLQNKAEEILERCEMRDAPVFWNASRHSIRPF